MASLNKSTIIGRLGKDVELKSSNNGGSSYAYFSVATDDYMGKGDDGTVKTETTWHNVKVFGKLADTCGRIGKKGMTVYVEGRAEHRKDPTKEGVVYHNILGNQVLFIGSANGNGNGNGHASSSSESTQAEPSPAPAQAVATSATVPADDDLPF